MYEVGDLIVYGRTGICEVTEITTLKMDGVPKDKLYYILRKAWKSIYTGRQ